MTLGSLRLELLAAREARAARISRLAAALPEGRVLVVLSLNVPGPDKNSPRLERLFERARGALVRKAGALRHNSAEAGAWRHSFAEDALGPWMAVACAGNARDIKRGCVAIEEQLAAGRLVDLDVFDERGRQVDRAFLGLPARRCLVCEENAADCMRTGRHGPDELTRAVSHLLHASECAAMADCLVQGARIELELTPKPGLVDRRDNGSHPDLSFGLMERSIDLLPQYYEDLLRLVNPAGIGFHDGRVNEVPLDACVAAGRKAEQRMVETIGTNAHRGYIFLSGLVLLAFSTCTAEAPASPRSRRPKGRRPDVSHMPPLSRAVAAVARRLLRLRSNSMRGVAEGSSLARSSHGEEARSRHRVRGVIGEALNGLPSVFGHGLPALASAEARFGFGETAQHAAMATLMTVVEDTTTLHRGGAAGLERLRRDGHRILDTIERGEDCVVLLQRLNDEFCAAGLTMGGVADCLAVTIAMRTFATRPG